MKISKEGLDLIVRFEGKHKLRPDGRYEAYLCPAGVWTIYAGLTKGVHKGMVITEEEGKRRLDVELDECEAAVNDAVRLPMTQGQFDSLVSFAFNLGTGALRSSTIVKLLNADKPLEATKWFAPYNKARDPKTKKLVVLPGLVRRRAAEAAMFLKPDEIAPEPEMPQKVETVAIAETHHDAHQMLKADSGSYSLMSRLLKALGLPAALVGGAGATGSETGLQAYAPFISFFKDYGFKLAIGIVGLIVVAEIVQAVRRARRLA